MALIKVVTLNLWGEQPPLERRMELIITGLRALEPDLVALQEVRERPGALPNQAAVIAAALGLEVYYQPAILWGGGEEGLALLSRYPLGRRTSTELPHAHAGERRIALGVAVETPDGPVAAFTTHLNYRLGDGAKRADQVAALCRWVAAEAPAPAPRILMGDFNAVPDSDEIRYLKGLHSMGGERVYHQDAFAQRHPGELGYTWARRNPFTQKMSWLEPDRRIDYIFVSPMARDGRGRIHECRIVLDRPDGTGCFPSDHFGLYAEVQLAADAA